MVREIVLMEVKCRQCLPEEEPAAGGGPAPSSVAVYVTGGFPAAA